MVQNYQCRRHNKNLLFVHLIFVTKYRHKVFSDKTFAVDVKNALVRTCVKYHWYVKRLETDEDHVHILLQYNPTDSISNIVARLKQESTYFAWTNYAGTLRRYYWKKKILWSRSYFVASVGNVSRATIEKYIENQG